MKRRPVQLTPDQEAALASLADSDGISISEHVRRAVDRYLWLLSETERLLDGKARAGGTLAPHQRLLIYLRDGFRCTDCGISGRPGAAAGSLHVHHLRPGNHGADHLVTLCTLCHGRADAERRREEGRPPTREIPGVYSVPEAAAILGVGAARVRFLLGHQRLAGERVGREWVISAESVANFQRLPIGWQKGRKRGHE